MFCRNCAKEIESQSSVCPHCGVPQKFGVKHCWNCAAETDPKAVICVKCGVQLKKLPRGLGPASEYDWPTTLALNLLLFLGFGGIHRMYTGHWAVGFVQLFTFGGCFIWQLVDLIQILQGNFRDVYGNVVERE